MTASSHDLKIGAASEQKRHLPSWIESFYESTDQLDAPDLFRTWTAISVLTGAMERNCWIETPKGKLFPNMFILLTAPPAVGKGLILNAARDQWGGLGESFRLAPSHITKAALIDYMFTRGNNGTHTCIFASSEFGNLVPEHDKAWLNTLNDLYDCPDQLEERTRSKGAIMLRNTFLHILGATQPKFLSTLLPDEAYDMGFMSRMIMVYGNHKESISFFGTDTEQKDHSNLRTTLKMDLRQVRTLHGAFKVSKEAQRLMDGWVRSGIQPAPTHTKLQAYCGRRAVHIAKLAMAFSISEGNTMALETHHFEQARELLITTEAVMPQIFREMTVNTYGEIIDEVFEFILNQEAIKPGKPVAEHYLVNYLRNKVPMNQINYVLEVMIRGKLIRKEHVKAGGKMIEGYITTGTHTSLEE